MYNNITTQEIKLFKMYSKVAKFRDILNINKIKQPHTRLALH